MAANHRYVPQPLLSAFVEFFWLYEGDIPPHQRERRLPDGSTELVINLYDDRTRFYVGANQEDARDRSGGVLSRPQSTYTLLDTSCLVAALGVHFRPGGALPFLPFPMSELRNEVVSLETLWGAQVTDIRGQLCDAATPAERFANLDRFLRERLASSCDASAVSHPSVALGVKAFRDVSHMPTVASVAEHVGLSKTRFIQVFCDAVGLTPKQYARLCRFQHAPRLVDANALPTWGDLVVACGYFDQSHLIQEFQTFASLSPTAFVAMRSEYCNHVPHPA